MFSLVLAPRRPPGGDGEDRRLWPAFSFQRTHHTHKVSIQVLSKKMVSIQVGLYWTQKTMGLTSLFRGQTNKVLLYALSSVISYAQVTIFFIPIFSRFVNLITVSHSSPTPTLPRLRRRCPPELQFSNEQQGRWRTFSSSHFPISLSLSLLLLSPRSVS